MTDRILLNNMVFQGRHGWHEQERLNPQRFEVDVELYLDLRPAATSDDLQRTVDYGAVFDVTRRIVESRSYRLLEALAEAIAGAILADFAPVQEVVVRIRKPQVALRGELDWSGVEIRRPKATP